MKLKDKYTKTDIAKFDRLVTGSEAKGFNNPSRNIARVQLNSWLAGFTEKTKDAMWQIVKDM